MANYEKTQYGKEGFFLGNNIAESGTVTASALVPQGTVLVRDSAKLWVPATSSTLIAGAGLGIAIADIESGTAVPCDIGIGGRFNGNFIKVGDDPISEAQKDLLRGQGIIILNINSIDK